MSEKTGSRIEEARRRTLAAKKSIGAAVLAGFLAAVGLAWVSHPGSAPSSGTSVSFASDDAAPVADKDFDFGSGSIAPSENAVPQVRTSVS